MRDKEDNWTWEVSGVPEKTYSVWPMLGSMWVLAIAWTVYNLYFQ